MEEEEDDDDATEERPAGAKDDAAPMATVRMAIESFIVFDYFL